MARSGPWCDKCGAPILEGRTEFLRELQLLAAELREAVRLWADETYDEGIAARMRDFLERHP